MKLEQIRPFLVMGIVVLALIAIAVVNILKATGVI